MSWPSDTWLERPWPRRSIPTTRYPCSTKNIICIPVVATERPALVEDNRLATFPVFVEDLGAVVGCDRAHGLDSVAAVGRSGLCKGLPMTAGRHVAKAPTAAELARKPRRLSDDDVAGMIFSPPRRATCNDRHSQPML